MERHHDQKWLESIRELSRRASGGIEVVLLWRPATGQVSVCVTDQREGMYFELNPPKHLALDVFNHPYSYVDQSDLYFEDSRLAA